MSLVGLNYISGEFAFYDKVIRQMLDLDAERLSLMDAAGVDVAVLSLWNPRSTNVLKHLRALS